MDGINPALWNAQQMVKITPDIYAKVEHLIAHFERLEAANKAPVYATLIYHILVPAHGPDICTAVTAHHPNFSHLLYAAGDAGGG
jgi:hypothetical protein